MNLVMLDIDGTLIQSYEYDREVFGQVIGEALGCPPVDADLHGYVDKTSLGVTQEAIRRVAGKSPDEQEIGEVKRRVLKRFEEMQQDFPELFSEVPGASRFLEELRRLDGVGIAIATGCWLNEALFKLNASGLSIDGIPISSSDDSRDRTRIMKIAAEKAKQFYNCPVFEHIVYIGDGEWDLQACRALGYGFVGIGPRVQDLKDTEGIYWHQDFLDLQKVFDTITATLHQEKPKT
jgi:phosphoglycolate phosphatase-like HAD superfamily hydrolase